MNKIGQSKKTCRVIAMKNWFPVKIRNGQTFPLLMKERKRGCKLIILKMKSYIFQLILGFRDSNSENNKLL